MSEEEKKFIESIELQIIDMEDRCRYYDDCGYKKDNQYRLYKKTIKKLNELLELYEEI